MRFLRALTNALLGSLLFCYLLTLLVVDLNINLALSPGLFLKLMGNLMILYGLPVALGIVLVHLAYRFIAGRTDPLPFVSPPTLTLSTAILILAGLVILRENTGYFAAFFVPGFQSLLRGQMIALLVLALSGLVAHFQYRHRKRRPLVLGVYFALVAAAISVTLWQRMSFPPPRSPVRMPGPKAPATDKRVILLGLEGLSLDFVLPFAADGKLPNFSALMEGGSWGRLEGFTPNDPFILRYTLLTGKYPSKHRMISDVRYSLPGLRRRLEIVPRFILFRQFTRLGILAIEPNDVPPRTKDLSRIAADFGLPAVFADAPRPYRLPFAPDLKHEKLFRTAFQDTPVETGTLLDRLRQAFLRDAAAEERAFQAKAASNPRVFSLVLDGLDLVESVFYKYSIPESFGEIKQDEIQRYGPVIRHYYQYYDQIIGKCMAGLRDDEYLIVYSTHGIEPLPFWKRLVEWILGNSDVAAYHEQAPDGAVFFFGQGIERGRKLDAVRLVDILPTLLYAMHLPVGKDMDGIVRAAVFIAQFTQDNPVFTITSYEDVEPGSPPAPARTAPPAK